MREKNGIRKRYIGDFIYITKDFFIMRKNMEKFLRFKKARLWVSIFNIIFCIVRIIGGNHIAIICSISIPWPLAKSNQLWPDHSNNEINSFFANWILVYSQKMMASKLTNKCHCFVRHLNKISQIINLNLPPGKGTTLGKDDL